MAKRLKKGQEVRVITGPEKGKSGKIIQVLQNDRVIVEGICMRTKHEKASQTHPEGTISKREGSIHASNVMDLSKFNQKKIKS